LDTGLDALPKLEHGGYLFQRCVPGPLSPRPLTVTLTAPAPPSTAASVFAVAMPKSS
jgi:hypothetical protein